MESNQEILEIALTNLLEEFRKVRQQQGETNKAIGELKDKVGGFEQKLNNVKVIPPSINTLPITDTINQGMEKIKTTIEEQPKSVKREFRILLFPQSGATEYYKLVFGRILFWLLNFSYNHLPFCSRYSFYRNKCNCETN